MATTAWSARESKIMVDSKEIEGLQSIEFKEHRNRSDIPAIGESLRQGVEYGVKVINGKIKVKSTCSTLDEKFSKKEVEDMNFTLSAQLKKGSKSKTMTFQDCYIDDREYSMEVNGVGITTYTFSATDVQE
jgi:hypothetical protein